MTPTRPVTATTYLDILAVAHDLFDDLEERGFGRPTFSLGGGTVLMLRFNHRLSKDIDLFGWLDELAGLADADLAAAIVPYDGVLRHESGMASKVARFIRSELRAAGA